MYFVYLLQSFSSTRFYVGHCDHLIERFREHQAGWNKSTKNRGPWWMPYFEIYPTRAQAMAREAEIKRKKSSMSIRRIIHAAMPDLELL